MLHPQDLIQQLRKQREMLDELISKVGEVNALQGISRDYDITTQLIEKNLRKLRKSVFNTPKPTRRK